MAASPDGADIEVSRLAAERILEASLAVYSGAGWAQSTPDPEQRYLSAYAAVAERVGGIVARGLEQARNRLALHPDVDPLVYLEIVCEEIEARYRAEAGDDDFARRIGALVNARVMTLPPLDAANPDKSPQ